MSMKFNVIEEILVLSDSHKGKRIASNYILQSFHPLQSTNKITILIGIEQELLIFE